MLGVLKSRTKSPFKYKKQIYNFLKRRSDMKLYRAQIKVFIVLTLSVLFFFSKYSTQ